ncbi:MAG: aspartate kinase [Paenisporosarcina sp.]
MSRKVMKFGGTSVGSTERIRNVAKRIIGETSRGHEIVVVVSAMGKSTDEMVRLAKDITSNPSKREMDMLLSTGEQVTIALLTMALQHMGQESVSFTGWQAGIVTESVHGNARIAKMNPIRIEQALTDGKVVVVAGFQGMDYLEEITTLGRGGSDTTAVAIAASIKADLCDIYTDVDGIYTSDPRFVEGARKLEELSYDEMLELANLGAGVLHPRAVEFAKNYGMPLSVRSSLSEVTGTILSEEPKMEKNLIVRGVAFEPEIVRLTIGYEVPFNGSLAKIFTTLAKHHVNVDIIVQSIMEGTQPSVSFSIKKEDFATTIQILDSKKTELGYQSSNFEVGLAKVSIVGSGMVSNPGVAAQMFDRLRKEGIPVKMVSTSEIKVSVVVPESDMLKAANALHDEFNLASV